MRGNTWYSGNLRQVYILVCPSMSTEPPLIKVIQYEPLSFENKYRAQVNGHVSINQSKAAECLIYRCTTLLIKTKHSSQNYLLLCSSSQF